MFQVSLTGITGALTLGPSESSAKFVLLMFKAIGDLVSKMST